MPVTGTVTVDNAQPIPVAVASVPRWFQTLLVTATPVTMTTARAGVIDYVAAMCMAPDDLDIKSFTMSSEGPFGSTSAGVQFVSDPFLRFTLAPMSDALDAIYVLAPTAVKLPFVQGTGRVVLSLLGGAENQCYVMLGGYYTE